MTVRFSVTVRQVLEDGSEAPADGEVAAALAGTAEQFAGLAAWAADEARFCDLGEREEVIGQEGRELQRRLLEATFAIDAAREERAGRVTSAAGIPHGSVEAGHERGVASVFGPVRVSRIAYRNRREPNLYPADARWILPMTRTPWECGPWWRITWPEAGSGRPRRSSRPAPGCASAAPSSPGSRTTLPPGPATSTKSAPVTRTRPSGQRRDHDAGRRQGHSPAPGAPQGRGEERSAHPGIKKMAEIVAVADFTPAPRAGGHRRPARPPQGPPRPGRPGQMGIGLDHQDIPAMIGEAFDEADRRDPQRVRQRVFLVDGNRQQITAIRPMPGNAA